MGTIKVPGEFGEADCLRLSNDEGRLLDEFLVELRLRQGPMVPGRIRGPRSATAGQLAPTNNPAQPAMQREGEVEEVADMILALILPSGRYVTGQAIHVNGGLYMP